MDFFRKKSIVLEYIFLIIFKYLDAFVSALKILDLELKELRDFLIEIIKKCLNLFMFVY